MPFWLEVVINVAFSYLASVGFALTINVPHRALNLSGISGTAVSYTHLAVSGSPLASAS